MKTPKCPDCSEQMQIFRTGQNHAFVLLEGRPLDWCDGSEWQIVECAACGRVLSEWRLPLDPPDSRPRRIQ